MAKKIIICCDGTWDTPEGKHVTNVTKMARLVLPADAHGMEQVVFYDWGVGTDDMLDRIEGGAFGEGIDKNIQDAYRFLVHNYAPGDELFFFGFSRGAYTVRSLVGMIRNCWLLTKEHADLIPKAYQIYRSRSGPDVKTADNFRRQYGRQATIKFLGVWDTVGALGIPLGLFKKENEEKYSFHDTTVSRIVENAYHALSIDEMRKPFAPTIWKTKPEHSSEQAWFAGVHADVGGGYPQAGLANLALKWMADKATLTGLAVDSAFLQSLLNGDTDTRLHNSYKGMYKLLGRLIRPMGVTNHDETVHASAIKRYQTDPGYRPKNLVAYLNR